MTNVLPLKQGVSQNIAVYILTYSDERTIVSSGFLTEGTLISASTVPHYGTNDACSHILKSNIKEDAGYDGIS